MSEPSRVNSTGAPLRATRGQAAATTGEVDGTQEEAEKAALHGDNYATGGGFVQPPLMLAGKPPVPEATAPRGISLRSGGHALRVSAQRTRASEDEGGSTATRQGQHATPESLAEQSARGDAIFNGGIMATVNKATAMNSQAMREDEARHRRNETLDIAKALKAGHQHIDNARAMRERGDRLQRAGIVEGDKNPAVRLAQMHRASEPGWTGGTSDAVSDTLKAASEAAIGGLAAFPLGRRELQG